MAEHGYNYYVKIWVYLMVLLVISIVGPTFEIMWLTLITAFGIAVVKSLMVASWFMHLNTEKRYIWLLLISSLIFLFGLYVGVAPDVQNEEGSSWTRCNAYSDADRARIEKEVAASAVEHPDFAGMNVPQYKGDCVPQKF